MPCHTLIPPYWYRPGKYVAGGVGVGGEVGSEDALSPWSYTEPLAAEGDAEDDVDGSGKSSSSSGMTIISTSLAGLEADA